MGYKKVEITSIDESAVRLFSQNWAILTAGDPSAFNSMTVSWGMLGELWSRHTAAVFIRPHRYTYGFAEKSDYFTLSFYDEEYKGALSAVFGSKSGRDVDKYKETDIPPVFEDNWVFCGKSRLVVLCKKIAALDILPSGFIDKSIEDCYPAKDYHRIFFGEISGALIAE